jgi:hypothetical protein
VSELVLPRYAGQVASWALTDWLDQSWTSAAADSSGVVTIVCDQLDSTTRWRITRAVVSSTSGSTSQCRLYRDTVSLGSLRSGTNAGNYDEADYPAGLWVPPTAALVAQWSGVATGATCTLSVQADIYRLAGSY